MLFKLQMIGRGALTVMTPEWNKVELHLQMPCQEGVEAVSGSADQGQASQLWSRL